MKSLAIVPGRIWSIRAITTIAMLLGFSVLQAQPKIPAEKHRLASNAQYATRSTPAFIQNKGQWPAEVEFLTKSGGLDTWVTERGVVYDFHQYRSNAHCAVLDTWYELISGNGAGEPDNSRRVGHVVRMEFIGSAEDPRPLGLERREEYHNYFTSVDPSEWASTVPLFGEVKMEGIYRGIDARFYHDGGRPRYDLIVHPGASPRTVAMRFDGAASLSIASNGDLVIGTSLGEARQQGLFAYQTIGGVRKQVPASFTIGEDGAIGFAIGAYDSRLPLVIDPLTYCTLLDGSGSEVAKDLEIDAAGNAYVVGTTTTSDFPTTAGAYDRTVSNSDGFVTKVNAGGTGLVFSTFIGSSGANVIEGVYLDGSGDVYVAALAGVWPTTAGAFDGTYGGNGDAAIAKLNSTGTALIYSTYLGGTDADRANDIDVDPSGNAYVVGTTGGNAAGTNNFTTTAGAYDITFNGGTFRTDAFAAKINSTGTTLVYSTYLGGNQTEEGLGIDVDDNGNAYVVGHTQSTNYPLTAGCYDAAGSGDDGFITKLNTTGTALIYSTFLGGNNGGERLEDIQVNAAGEAIVTGNTGSTDYPVTPGAYSNAPYTGTNVVVTKMNAAGNGLVASTMLGASRAESFTLDVDLTGAVYIGGRTMLDGGWPMTNDAFDREYSGSEDAVIAKLDGNLTTLLYGSYIGTPGGGGATGPDDVIWGVEVDGNGNVIMVGETEDNFFPTTGGSYDVTLNGPKGAFVAKLPIGLSKTIRLTDPNSGTIHCDSTQLRINWTSTGINGVRIELSSDGGATFPTAIIAAAPAAAGTYAWTIPATVAQGNQYRVRILDTAAGSTFRDTSDANFTINRKPVITAQPVGDTVCSGEQVQLSVTATGAGLTYQWRRNGFNLNGATGATYTIASPQAGDAGSYTVVVSGVACSVTSNAVPVVVNVPPSIGTQPSPVTVCRGVEAAFSVSATGTGLSYQWRKNGTNINGANGSSYTIASPQAADAGNYDVVVSGICSPVATSNAVALTVNIPPSITTEPSPVTVCRGAQALLSVNATGTALTYQWRKNGTNINGATGASYTIASPQTDDAGSYDVIVAGACAPPDTSSSATLTVNVPPAITSHPLPASRILCQGESTTFTVAATGTGLAYQWRKNGADIPGATGESYVINSAATSDAGTYDVVVSGTCSPAATSNGATLTVNVPPAILTQPLPANRVVCQGQSATFTVTAVGTGLTYKWRKNGVDIPGANGASYTVQSAQEGDAGSYDVVVSGACQPPVTSSAVTFTVNLPPSIAEQPVSATVCQREAVTFRVRAAGSELKYQWRKDGADIAGATSESYTIPSTKPADAGRYDVVISGVCTPSITSTQASLTVNLSPLLIDPPTDITICPGYPATFYASAVGTGITYQWRKNGTDIPGATGSSYTIQQPTAADMANYDVVVSGACAPAVTSGPARLEIKELPPSITKDPENQTVCAGELATLRVVATGSSLSYQWRKDGVNISGATRATYSILSVTKGDGGNYDVVVQSSCGSGTQTSGVATLTVNEPATITQQPENQEVCAGASFTLNVKAEGTGLSYQWRKNGVAIPGATSSSFTIASATTADAGRYDVVVGNSCASSSGTSMAAQVVVHAPASISQQPKDQKVLAGSPATFSVAASGDNLTYQWRKDGVDIPGANAEVYTIASVTAGDVGRYDVVLTGSCPTVVTSNAATLTVDQIGGVDDEAVSGGAILVVTPNPINSGGTIRLIPYPARVAGRVEMAIYDMVGRRVLDLTEEFIASGYQEARLDAHLLPAGLYYCRLTGAGERELTRMIVIAK